MADYSVGAREESHESEASQALMFRFDNASQEKTCFVVDIVCFISLCLRIAAFLNATRRDRNLQPFTSLSLGKIVDQCNSLKRRKLEEFTIAAETKVCSLLWCMMVLQHDLYDQYPRQGKEKLLMNILCLKRRLSCSCLRPPARNRTKQIPRCNNQANEL